MSSTAAFCEAPILDREWVDVAGWSEEHWYDFEPVAIYPNIETHRERHTLRTAPLLFNIDQLFRTLADQWDAETAYLSSVHEMVLNSSYQRIIGLGPLVLPSLLRDLCTTGRFWFWALTAITGENPVSEEDLGDVQRMTVRWIEWGRDRGLIT